MPTESRKTSPAHTSLPIIEDLIELAQTLHADAEDVFRAHQTQLAAVLSAKDFATVTRHIGQYQFSQAATLLEQVHNRMQASAT
ncbi:MULTISPECIES: hypothetical protein [Thiorhodovibrio]|uniref:hypothetical protein n=1 Tax=Thiorhodovibrio TaxID=61593 RepID=UPI001912EE0A|nr:MULTISPECIES: hypothetical protein [Thiorhodovibrio]MBK5968851.1 hypothetical protein [Thiorhodovibrio winogradskyi]WPL12621.1 hypothetical protein Thiosp_02395 [Thiorhodovibrio litoralis]